MTEGSPGVIFTRRVDRKKGDLFFGPFFAGTARRILKLIADQFKMRGGGLPHPPRKDTPPPPLPLLRHAPMPRTMRRRTDDARRVPRHDGRRRSVSQRQIE